MSTGAATESPSGNVAIKARETWIWLAGGLGVLAAVMIARWALFWRESPDFAHGWIVPLFAAYLAWERRLDRPHVKAPSARAWISWTVIFSVGAIAMLAGRLLLEPFSTWPAALWLFSAGGWAMMGALIALTYGSTTARHFAFPILFTATALPWPTMIDIQVILPLRAMLASIAAEVIHALGYPAIPQGTVIEVGRGQVGIDEACSGVRSLQAAIMIALLLGEVFRLRWPRRISLLVIALVIALLSNLARTCFLAWQGAKHGPAGVESWHDVAGALQMGVALGGMALVAWLWRHHSAEEKNTAVSGKSFPHPAGRVRVRVATLLIVVVMIEAGTRGWFASDSGEISDARWMARLPDNRSSFRASPFTPSMQGLLQCDSHQIGLWESSRGERRAGYILDWNRGHAARQTVALHNPEICLPYGGQTFVASRGTMSFPVSDRTTLNFRVSEFTGNGGTFYVFYVAWDMEHAKPLVPADDEGVERWVAYRLDAVTGRQNEFTARVVALAFYDLPDLGAAQEAFKREAPEIVARDLRGF